MHLDEHMGGYVVTADWHCYLDLFVKKAPSNVVYFSTNAQLHARNQSGKKGSEYMKHKFQKDNQQSHGNMSYMTLGFSRRHPQVGEDG